MECRNFEENLTEYLDRGLPPPQMAQIAEHLHECTQCAELIDEVRSIVRSGEGFPSLEPDAALIERILLRTSGRPRTRTLREILGQYVFKPVFTPRFAAGAALATLTLILSINFLVPRFTAAASVLAPREVFRQVDRGIQGLYRDGLKAYDKKNEWQAEFSAFKTTVLSKLGFMIEQLDVPMEGKQDSGEPRQQQEKAPGEKKSSTLLLPV